MLEAEVTPARRRPGRLVALIGLGSVLGVVVSALGVYAMMRDPRKPVAPRFVPAPVTVPAPAAPRATEPSVTEPSVTEPSITEPIEYIAAASEAPVIAIASGHRVWISRDDGVTFTPALHDADAEIYDLTVDPSGHVYAMWGEPKKWRSPGGGSVDTIEFALGVADPDGHERWRPVTEMISTPLDTRAGWIVGSSAPVIGRDFGASWNRPPSSASWHVWRASIDDRHTARFLASRIDAPESCEDCGRGLALLTAREGRPLTTAWSMLDRTAIMTDDFPSSVLACAGFAGSTLYLVTRERQGLRLLAVDGDGKPHHKPALETALPADATCTIAGNDRAAYLAIGGDMIRIDTDELRIAPGGAITPPAAAERNARDELAVDQHGALLYVAAACLWRYAEAGAGPRHKLVCGAQR